jgi:general secretion pathway protein K
VVAVASLAVLALLALTIIEATRGSTRSARAELDRARLSAAADAGIALAVQGLAQANAARRWRPDGRLREVQFGGAAIAIRIEDELGKVPLNQINEQQAEALFSAFGLQGAELEEARDAFLDWRDQDDDPRLRGRERTDYAQDGVRPPRWAAAQQWRTRRDPCDRTRTRQAHGPLRHGLRARQCGVC